MQTPNISTPLTTALFSSVTRVARAAGLSPPVIPLAYALLGASLAAPSALLPLACLSLAAKLYHGQDVALADRFPHLAAFPPGELPRALAAAELAVLRAARFRLPLDPAMDVEPTGGEEELLRALPFPAGEIEWEGPGKGAPLFGRKECAGSSCEAESASSEGDALSPRQTAAPPFSHKTTIRSKSVI